MRCADLIEAIAAPDGATSPATAEHLAHCPQCSRWVLHDARFERLWEATRPEEPPESSWAAVWAHVSQAIDSDATASPSIAPNPSLLLFRPPAAARPWQRWGALGFGIAQAAGLLLAACLGSGPAAGTATATTVPAIEIDDGALVMIESGREGIKIVRHAADEGSSAVDANYVMLGFFEAMAE